jgi:hypothetical protein
VDIISKKMDLWFGREEVDHALLVAHVLDNFISILIILFYKNY